MKTEGNKAQPDPTRPDLGNPGICPVSAIPVRQWTEFSGAVDGFPLPSVFYDK
jgi:hypothetical protein